jgi:hypothetical protein
LSDNVPDLPRCQGFKADGTRCERIIKPSETLCYSHDESRSAERRANASRAGKGNLSSEIVSIRAEIRRIMDDIRDGELQRADGAVLLQGAGYLLRSVAEARKQNEYEEIRTEMEELRTMFEQQQTKGGGREWATWTS